MTAQTGRTVSKWTKFCVDDSSGTLREIPVSSINGVGLDYDEVDMTALTPIHGVLLKPPNFTIGMPGPVWHDRRRNGVGMSAPTRVGRLRETPDGHQDWYSARMGKWRAAIWHHLQRNQRFSMQVLHRQS